MKCKDCGNTKGFTMVKETEYWDDSEKVFKPTDENINDEYLMCDMCNSFHIDTEGEY